ncbi:MAG: hypothetical protein KGD70_11060 [Candidatus Lokiarchaeota archaeon]|nr:hypothetical protein [Candidatus Lokiarchaeota archaeon]
MGLRLTNKKKYLLYILIVMIFTFIVFPVITPSNHLIKEQNLTIKPSETIEHLDEPWLLNPTFEDPIEPTWFSTRNGDLTDINASTSLGFANYEVLGGNDNFSNITDTPLTKDWDEFNNTYFILPDGTHEINENGCEASHEFQETFDQSRNRPSVHWRRNITMPVDMTDNIITSASLSAIVNGSGDTNLETPTDDLSYDGAGYFATYYDYARFYIKFSNLDYINLYEVAYFQTVDLGIGDQYRQTVGVIDYLNDTLMTVIDEPTLIFYLTKALEADSNNFGITLGIDIYCEDNYNAADRDTFYSLLIKSVNLTFCYEKKIDQLSSISWNQQAPEINGSNVKVTESNLKFKYKVSELWSGNLSSNSEIRILINDKRHSETIKLTTADITFQEAKSEGFNLIDITFPYETLNISLQLFLADEFGLADIYSFSIDDVYLEISYTETIIDPGGNPEPLIFRVLLTIAIIAGICIGGYFIAYYKLLRFPKAVRKVRKYRSTLRSTQNPSTEITNREKGFKDSYNKELNKTTKHLKGKPTESKVKFKNVAKAEPNTPDKIAKTGGGGK